MVYCISRAAKWALRPLALISTWFSGLSHTLPLATPNNSPVPVRKLGRSTSTDVLLVWLKLFHDFRNSRLSHSSFLGYIPARIAFQNERSDRIKFASRDGMHWEMEMVRGKEVMIHSLRS